MEEKDKVEKEILFTDGNGNMRKISPELKQKLEETAEFLNGYGYSFISQSERYEELNKLNSDLYQFGNQFKVNLILIGILLILSIGSMYEGYTNFAYILLIFILLMIISLYLFFKKCFK